MAVEKPVRCLLREFEDAPPCDECVAAGRCLGEEPEIDGEIITISHPFPWLP